MTTFLMIEALSATGMTPVEFMTAVYRDEDQPMELRLEAASRVAPYFHAKMSAFMSDPATIRDKDELHAIEAKTIEHNSEETEK